VGSVMRSNRHPLIVPCHRVIAANGRLGGYSAHEGVSTKAMLLSREGVCHYAKTMGLG
jgi:methylated-DNA-[protein]-cysteine S-methyltransferase